jgi:GH18 family chitinase
MAERVLDCPDIRDARTSRLGRRYGEPRGMTRSRSGRLVVAALLVVALVLPAASLLVQRAAAAQPDPAPWPRAVAGEQVAVTGSVPQRVRRPLVLQQRVGRRWQAVETGRSERSGRYRFHVPARNAVLRVHAPVVRVGRERLPAWTSSPRRVRVEEQRGTLTAPATVPAGTLARLTATFTPARPGRPVALEVQGPGGWTQVARGSVDARGTATLTHAPAATTTYRAVAAPWRGAAAAPTASTTVVVPLPGPGPHPGPGPEPEPELDPADWVTGYYAGYFWDWMYQPQQVDMTAMTHFVFGRVAPGGGSLSSRPSPEVPFADVGEVVEGAGTAHEPGLAPDGSGRSVERYLVDEAHAAGTKALLMLGGDGADGRGFMLSTADDETRARFVENVVDYLVQHDYDGVDLDWENCLGDGDRNCGEYYNPPDAPEAPDPSDPPIPATEKRARLLALIDDLRAEMATRERYAETPGLITFPGYPLKINDNEGRPEAYQVDVALKVDQYNLMSYGVGTTWNGGGWDSWFSGALHGAEGNHPVDISSSIAAYEAAGVPRKRLGIGIGFYGIYYGPTIDVPRQPTRGNDIYEVQDAALYYGLLDKFGYLDHGKLHWDEVAKSTYRVYGERDDDGFVPTQEDRNPAGFLSYEDERSIAAKGRWVRETGVGGTIIWMVNYGWVERLQQNPLLDAVKKSFLE